MEEADLDFSNVVATNVYLDNLSELPAMNKIYALFLGGVAPARTTIQQVTPVDRPGKHPEGIYPAIEQIAVK